MLAIENALYGKAAIWFRMIKDEAPNEELFKQLFLKQFFSERKQWEIIMKCAEAGKKPIKNNFQEHFYFWMTELKHLDSPKIEEEQAINLITKHLPIEIQAFIQTIQPKKFLSIWEKLEELENNNLPAEENEKRETVTQSKRDIRPNVQHSNIPYRQNQSGINSQQSIRLNTTE